MARVTSVQTNFTTGEISPRLHGRTDIERYNNGARSLINAHPVIHGGAKRRAGTRFVKGTKIDAKQSRLIPFVHSRDEAYMLEVGDNYLRVFGAGGVDLAVELATSFTESMLDGIDYTHGEDTMFLFHESLTPQKLVTTAPTTWNLTSAAFINVPYEEPGTNPVATLTPSVAGPVGFASGLTASVGIFSPATVGSVVKVNGGLVLVDSYSTPTFVSGHIKRELTSTSVAQIDAWSLHAPAWSASLGYPRTGTLFEQRLVCGGSPTYPQTVWGSATAAYLDFLQNTADDDAFSFTIAATEVNPISYLTSMRNLAIHTYGGEFSMQGGIEKPITPTNVRVRAETSCGSKGVRPVTVGKESVFVQRSGRKVRAFGFQAGADDYAAPDLTVFAEHLMQSYGISGLTFQQEPEGLLWAWREDGAFLSSTIDRDQSVLGWAPHYTDGAVESMATIPNGDRDETWLIVRRTVNGATVRYIEILDDIFEPLLTPAPTGYPPFTEPTVYGYTVDCGLSFDNALGQTTFAVPHLIGCTVDIVADGRALPQQVVPVSGNVTIDAASVRTLIGLHFESEVGLLAPEVGTGSGSAQGNSMRVGEITLSLLNTLGAKVFDGDGDEQEVPWRELGEGALDTPPTPFTGLHRLENLGWERGKSEITIKQDQPLPMHVRAVIRKLTVND